MTSNVEKALEIVRNFIETEFHSFMEMLYVSEYSNSNISFNELIGKDRVTDKESSYRRFASENNIELIQNKSEQRTYKRIYHIQHVNAFHSHLKAFMRPFQGVSTKHLNNYLVWYAWMKMNKELSEESLERNILNSSMSHNFRLLASEISQQPALPLAA